MTPVVMNKLECNSFETKDGEKCCQPATYLHLNTDGELVPICSRHARGCKRCIKPENEEELLRCAYQVAQPAPQPAPLLLPAPPLLPSVSR